MEVTHFADSLPPCRNNFGFDPLTFGESDLHFFALFFKIKKTYRILKLLFKFLMLIIYQKFLELPIFQNQGLRFLYLLKKNFNLY